MRKWEIPSCITLLVMLITDVIATENTAIIFPENNDRSSVLELDLDDLEYERDNEDDTLVPRLAFPRDESKNFVRLPNQEGEFQVVTRFSVAENKRDATSFDAAKYVVFRLYSWPNQSVELRFDQIRSLPDQHGYNLILPTKILIHGWLGSSESEVIEPLAREFLEQGNLNVLAVDWEKGASTILYPVARYRVPKVAELVAAVINQMIEFGQSPDRIGIIGHSLGAHIAGLAGKRTSQKIAFIIGLDPASPLFRMKKPQHRLADTDAKYVEVIHTNGRALGLFGSIGKADFYPNGGKQQPGCGWNLSCSHQRAVDYFKESLKVKDYFAKRCADEADLHSNCTLGRTTLGGFEIPRLKNKPKGVYHLLTAATKPFLRKDTD